MKQTDIIEKTIDLIIQQGNRALQNTHCVYKNDKGHKCAVGHWLSKKQLSEIEPVMDTIGDVEDLFHRLNIVYLKKQPDLFWHRLQMLHDNSNNWRMTDDKLSLSEKGILYLEIVFNYKYKAKTS